MAYFLRQMGHDVTIFESMPKAAECSVTVSRNTVWLRQVLDEEIADHRKMGAEIITNTKVGVGYFRLRHP